MKWSVKYRIFAAISLLIIVIIGLAWHADPASADVIKLEIDANPVSFLNIGNMKPGDSQISQLTIRNVDDEALAYELAARFISGDRSFFELLDFGIRDGDTIIYEGKLSGITQQTKLGELDVKKEDTIVFTIAMPPEAGNEFQGKEVKVAFDFDAVTNPAPVPDPGSSNPPEQQPGQQPDQTPTETPEQTPDQLPDQTPDQVPDQTPTAQTTEPPSVTIPAASQPNEDSTQGAGQAQSSELELTQGPLAALVGDAPPAMPMTLPKTAANWYNLVLVSSLLIAASGFLLIKLRQKPEVKRQGRR
ncbi:hypothetical protein A8990_10658 [Paenibacillus taihuensis]|uniref:LPXTG-motif cell wall-anchored protein n=1 Tax=Paenibacillus taihuensis TaxID=1156355 RepID=A0A3D9SC52_9BACL|nr:hypothetical protein [Paenibacillus taihuensis]REE90555.1 hypothetical protein A8990_10658 [Paenibacillus taihuensis]